MLNRWDFRYIEGAPWDRGEPPSELFELVESKIIKPCKTLDIGCGTGSLLLYLAKRGFEVTGIDVSKIAIERARRRFKENGLEGNLIEGDIFEIDIREEFELITDYGCYHAQEEERRYLYPDILRGILRRRGDFFLWTKSEKEDDSEGPERIERSEIEENFLEKDFELVELRDVEIGRWKGYFVWLRYAILK